ncbi:hypothetical protein B0T26DRAFT_768319 [Lasiosphaeria miniovina]|uniref:Uncharacterized protein n=1 Tax=Lasiosphaeria miniovina TaxID=1954250 RepID=A0AA40EAS5_9PEZI|nr:uncharacterized protein B0T26DRAFT_768319 [Lasiosphaeria miniovina]KAK0728628.1 hypothetical protein B0T26DRAFT_768319 [Lasiosphaeria miniovina]
MCDTVLAFGENDSSYLECPTRMAFDNLPADVQGQLSNGVVAETYSMALGPNGSYVWCYKHKTTGKTMMATNGIPDSLKEWIWKKDAGGAFERTFQKIRVNLHPNGTSFYAVDGVAHQWKGLQDPLSAELTGLIKDGQFTDTPRIVTFGAGADYLVITHGGKGFWRLNGHRELREVLDQWRKEGVLGRITNLALSPFKPEVSAILVETGLLIVSGLPDRTKQPVDLLVEATKADTARIQEQREQAEYEQAAAKIRSNQRKIDLLNMATAQADAQTRWNMESSAFMGSIGTRCNRCYGPYCTCSYRY